MMMPEYFQTCICCDDPIEVQGFYLHVCEKCRRETGDTRKTEKQIIACCLYQAEFIDEDLSLGAH